MNETRTAAEGTPSSPGHDSPAALLVDLAERAAARLMRRDLSPGQASVAVTMKLRHVAGTATPFAHWHVTVRRTAVRGRLHDFSIEVFDDSGLIGSAEHTRAVAVEHRLLAIARHRVGRPSMLLQA
jgi:predicted thioesterase